MAAALLVCLPAHAQNKRETRPEMARIVANALCLAEAYPGSPIASDAEATVALYAPLLGTTAGQERVETVQQLARELDPGKRTPVGDRNLALAKCLLFAEGEQVRKALLDR